MIPSWALYRTILLASLMALSPLGMGCRSSPTADSPVGMEYSGGSLRSVEDATLGEVWRASRAALNALDIAELDAQGGTTAAYVEGRTPDLKKVSVKMRALSATKTELKIRVGTFGDQALARQVYEKIGLVLAP